MNIVFSSIIALVYFLWSSTWRLKVIPHPKCNEALQNGQVAFAHWHGDELVLVRIGRRFKSAAMTSTSKDGELMTRVLKIFGFGVSRGSSTRGGARALLGMVRLVGSGYNATFAVDGPKGPRHQVKPGIFYLAQHAAIPVIPTGVATSSAYVFEKSWNKAYLPWPFARIIVSFGEPLAPPDKITEENLENQRKLLEEKLHRENIVAKTTLESGDK